MKRLSEMEDVALTAFADVSEATVQDAANKFGAKAYTDAAKMLDENELDAVYICIPPFAHGQPEKLAIERNLAMFVEKPVHLDLSEARDFVAEIERRNLVTSVGYQERYIDVIGRFKDELAQEKIGLVMGYWLGGVPGVAWWRKRHMSGGQAVEQTTHVFDMARYLVGEVKAVQAVGMRGLIDEFEGYDTEDASAANLVFENGAIGTIFSGCFLKTGQNVPNGLDIFCRNTTINYRLRSSVTVARNGETSVWRIQNDYQNEADRAFIDAVKAKNPAGVKSSYADGVRSLELTLAVNKAIDTKETVELPL